MASLFELTRGLCRKLAIAGFVLGLATAGCGLWLFLGDKVDFGARRQERLRTLAAERGKIQSAMGDVRRRLESATSAITTEQERIRQTDGVIVELKRLDNTWDKLTGDAQQRSNSERRQKLEQARVESVARVAALRQEFTRTTWERDGWEIDLGKVDAGLRATEASRSEVLHYLGRAWNYPVGWLKLKWWLAILLGPYLLMPASSKRGSSR